MHIQTVATRTRHLSPIVMSQSKIHHYSRNQPFPTINHNKITLQYHITPYLQDTKKTATLQIKFHWKESLTHPISTTDTFGDASQADFE